MIPIGRTTLAVLLALASGCAASGTGTSSDLDEKVATAAEALTVGAAGAGAPSAVLAETPANPHSGIAGDGPAIHAAHGQSSGPESFTTAPVAPGGYLYDPSPVTYQGGNVMSSTTKLYYIWYGNWSGNNATTILPNFAKSLAGSSWYNINTSFGDSTKAHVRNAVQLGGQFTVTGYPQGSALTDASIKTIVTNVLNNNQLPTDVNGIYLVLTSSDVTEVSSSAAGSAGFCKQNSSGRGAYCGWHYWATIKSTAIKYAFIGDPSTQAACKASGTSCEFTAATGYSTSPNGNKGADSMASVIAHEVSEAVTDPQITTWTGENADACAWRFGSTYSATNGGTANVRLGSADYLIQQNLINNGRGGSNGTGVCAMQLLRNNNVLWRDGFGNTQVWRVKGGTAATTGTVYAPGTSWQVAGTPDLDGDAQSEILWRDTVFGDVVAWFMNGQTFSSSATVKAGQPLVWQVIGTGDFDDDGKSDILWRNTSTGDVTVWFMKGTTIASTATVSAAWPPAWTLAGVGDFNGDDKSDILWRNGSTGDVRMWIMNGSSIASTTLVQAAFASAWITAGTRDFDGNGKSDILWRNTSTGDVRLWLMNGATIATNTLVWTALDLAWTIKGTGDLNGDGNSDILFQHSNGSTQTWLMQGATVLSTNALTNSLGWTVSGMLSDQAH